MKIVLWAALITGASCSLAQAEQEFRSGEKAVPLLELFTSEGCSSCPPAERWLGELRSQKGLWRDFVPVAWHVNYWDRLGWPDKFADQRYTDRQYAYAERWKARNVYTPGLVRGGEEWRIRDGGMKQSGLSVGGDLVAKIRDGAVLVTYSSIGDDTAGLQVNIARLGGGISNQVRAGENRGKRLDHEFLVLSWSQHSLGKGPVRVPLPNRDADVETSRDALAVWVSRGDDPTPLQAVGGWLE
ncbi:MAG: hypothetical protein SynsKO_41360 [Synoicihabitans sp.]